MTVLDTVKGLIAAHGANAVGAFTVADIQAMVDYIEAAEAYLDSCHETSLQDFLKSLPQIKARLAEARRALGLAEKEAGRG